jgi:hypothetical protein
MDDLNMTKINAPAFPRNYDSNGHNGLTKREYFATLCLQGLLANSVLTQGYSPAKRTAEEAVTYADALIEALNQ